MHMKPKPGKAKLKEGKMYKIHGGATNQSHDHFIERGRKQENRK